MNRFASNLGGLAVAHTVCVKSFERGENRAEALGNLLITRTYWCHFTSP
jgi:hypothetical protein